VGGGPPGVGGGLPGVGGGPLGVQQQAAAGAPFGGMLAAPAQQAAGRRLRDEGCCGRCVLRLLGVSGREPYRKPLAEVEASLDQLIGGRRGGERASMPAPKARAPQPDAASAGDAAGAEPNALLTKRIRAFVTTPDPTLFTGAKLVHVGVSVTAELAPAIAAAVGHPGVVLQVRLNDVVVSEAEGGLEMLGGNPRLVVARGAPSGAAAPPPLPPLEKPRAEGAAEDKEFVCCACLGTLQHATELCEQMLAAIKMEEWECPPGQRTSLGIGLPSDVLVRQRLLGMVAFPDGGAQMRHTVHLKGLLHSLFEEAAVAALRCRIVQSSDHNPPALRLGMSWTPSKDAQLSDAHRVAVSVRPAAPLCRRAALG